MSVSKSYILKGCFGYAAVAVFEILILQIQDKPGVATPLFTCDDMRPFLGGVFTFLAISEWNWTSSTAEETWFGYTRYWVVTYMIILMAGLGLLFHFGPLSKAQDAEMLFGIALGALMGMLRVLDALVRNELD